MLNRPLAALLLLCLAPETNAVTVTATSDPIRIDAVLNEPAWSAATPIPIDREWFPGDDIAAAVETDVLVTWNENMLYVAFRARDPRPHEIRARYSERDNALSDDNVGFLLDPFNDRRIAYQFRINPLGVQADAINSDVEGTEDFSWDAIWESAGRITADGYVVEVAIPLQQLRIPAGGGEQTWAFMAMRDYPRNVRHRFRSVVTDENRNCLICQFGSVSGFSVPRVGRNIEVTPTLTGNLRQERGSDGFETADDGIEPGLSGRWAITPSTSLQATINPDFSQVEADAAELDVNTRFALSFPEKRPFFLEGADFFETQLPLVFTRTIADPVAGLKLTGKTGRHAYGLLLAHDEITNFLIPFDQTSLRTSLDRSSNTAIARYRGSLSSSATAGVLFSSRTGADYSNSVLSADTFLRVSEQDSIRLQVAGSRSSYPDSLISLGQPEGTIEGHSLLARYDHNDRNWYWLASYSETAPEFRADTGLFNQVAVRSGQAGISRRFRGGPDRWFRNLYLELFADTREEFDGDWREWGADISATYQGSRQSTISLLIAPNQEHFLGTTYHNTRYNVEASIQATPDLFLSGGVNWGETIDFTNRRASDFVTTSAGAGFHLGRQFQGEVSWVRQTFDTLEGKRVFVADIPQARLLYHFSRRTFVRAILQHRDVDRNPSQYIVPVGRENRTLLSQLLFSYRLDAQTVFLAGYSDNYAGTESIDLTQTDRAVFLKLSYAWLF